MTLRRKFACFMVALATIGAGASVAVAAAGDEPGPASADVTADYWGPQKSLDVLVTIERQNRPPIVVGVKPSYEREPAPDGGLNLFTDVRINEHTTGDYTEIWRDDAPPLFRVLDRLCPTLKNAC